MEEVFDDLIGKFWTNDRIVEMEKLAEEQGWRFAPRERFAEQTTDIKNFRLFKGKRGKRVIGMMDLNQDGASCKTRIYDYIYYSDGGKKKTTVIEVYSRDLHLARFRIYPKKSIRNLFRRPGNHNDPFDAFGRHYQIETSDREATDMELPDSVLALLGADKGYSLEGEGNYLIYYRKGKQMQVNEILVANDVALGIVEAVLFDRENDYV